MFTKKEVKRYDIHANMEWAVVLLAGDGVFSVVSTFGNYGNYWSHTGCADVREFFLSLGKDSHYFAKKLCSEEVVDDEASEAALYEYLCEKYQGDSSHYSPEELKGLLEDMPSFDDITSLREWLEEETGMDEDIFDLSECLRHKLNPQVTTLVQMLTEHWVPILQKELNDEGIRSDKTEATPVESSRNET